MVDLRILTQRGITSEKLKTILDVPLGPSESGNEKETAQKQSEQVSRLRDRIRSRIVGVREDNIANHRIYHALDMVWDTPLRQISPTLLQDLVDRDPDEPTVMATLKSWGLNLNDCITETPDPKNPNKPIRRISAPSFFEIAMPIVRAYTTIRLAKIMNDRRTYPLFPYFPAINDAKGRLQCSAITNRIAVMAQQYGYWNVMKQCVFQMLHYGVCLQFPVEEWHYEEQEVYDAKAKETPIGSEALESGLMNPEAPAAKNGKAKRETIVTREGIRYHAPHPAKMGWDKMHRPSTFNTDSGCEFALYWRVLRYKDIRDNDKFWNRDRVNIGDMAWWDSASVYWNTVYRNCTIKTPGTIINTLRAGSNDRESKALYTFYNQTMDDAAVVVTEYFEKLVPKDNGLGNYEHPVWFRFVIGGDDTILYAAPLPYCPIVAYLYDADELRDQNASLSLEALPFQDQLSNLLSQFLLTVKQNLSNVTFVDTDVIDQPFFNKLRNLGEKLYRVRNFFGFSGRKALKSQQNVPQAFFSHAFPQMDANGIITAMRLVLDMLERVLVMSSQEVAQAASHELREKEVVNIQQSTSTRLAFTEAPVDDAIEAWKLQVYKGLMAYGEDSFWTQVPLDQEVTHQLLVELGFTTEDHKVPPGTKRLTLAVTKTAIELLSFASPKDAHDRQTNAEVAIQLGNALSAWLGNPILGPAIGADQGIMMVNMIAKIAGFPKEFKFENASNNDQMQQQLQEFAMKLRESIMGDVKQGMTNMMDLDKKQQQQIDALMMALRIPNTTQLPNVNQPAPANGAGPNPPATEMAIST